MEPIAFIRYPVFALLSFTFSCQGRNNNDSLPVRKPAVAGSFYPANADELRAELATCFKAAGNQPGKNNIAAIIVPHAGYVYSGEVAASAFAQIEREREYQHIFVIGTSHQVYLKGASVYCAGNFGTPLGIVPVDIKLAKQLVKENTVFEDIPSAHEKEHSLEVQLPFLQYWLKKPFKIVPIIIGTQSETTIQQISKALEPYFTDENLFVISSDFSHYPTYIGAIDADKTTGDAIATNSPDKFLKAIHLNEAKNIPGLVTSCCGWTSLLSLLYITSQIPEITIDHVQYKNSGDIENGDRSRVVGYHAFVFARGKTIDETSGFSLSKEEKTQLLKLARTTIENKLQNKSSTSNIDYTKALKTPCGAFVTLHKKGNLRGCIGRFITNDPLYKVVQQMALASAFEDTRFNPVEAGEMKDIDIEISVLTPLKRISSIDEFEYGKQGIYIKKGYRTGTFLPQVAKETRWTKEEFLGHCAQDKAGIGWDGWKDAELYTYEAIVFGE